MKPLLHQPWLPDETLARQIQSGGRDAEIAMQILYRKHRRLILYHIRNMLKSNRALQHVAEDILHDSFLVLMRKIESGRITTRSIAAFWYGIARMMTLHQQQKKAISFSVLEEETSEYAADNPTPEEAYIDQEARQLLLQCFQQLGDRCQRILLLWINRYSMAEIAQEMHLSGDAMARKIKHNCFKKLKEIVLQRNASPPWTH
jgi:RNA polymerase sigma factor (sigma-70 family)